MLVVLAFLFFIAGIVDIPIRQNLTKNVSYVIDRSLSASFVTDDEILHWIKNDVKRRKVNSFNIISFACSFSQSQIFSSTSDTIFIPKVSDSECSDLEQVLNSADLFNNVVIMSDFRTQWKARNDRKIELINLNDRLYDTLKIVSWQIPYFVVDNSRVKIVLQVWSRYEGLIEVNINYAGMIRKFYRKVKADRVSYITFHIKTRKLFEQLKIGIKGIDIDDRFLLNNKFLHRFIFIDKVSVYIEGKYKEALYELMKDFFERSDIEKAQIIILNTDNLGEALNIVKRFYRRKHIIVFIDSFILKQLSLYRRLERFLPVKLTKKNGKRFLFLIDISGSMNLISGRYYDIKGQTVLSGIVEVIKNLPEIKNIEIFLFNDRWNKLVFKSVFELEDKLAGIQFYGNTKISGVMDELARRAGKNDNIYIFSDTLVKDNRGQLENVIKKNLSRGAKLVLFHPGGTKGRLYRVFRKFGLKVVKFSSISLNRFLTDFISNEEKPSYLENYGRVYEESSGTILFEVEDILRTKLKRNSKNILISDAGCFISFSIRDGEATVTILKSADYFINNKLDIKEVLAGIIGTIIQVNGFSVQPYYFDGRIFLSTPVDNRCDSIIFRSSRRTIYFFRKSSHTYVADAGNISGDEWDVDICGKLTKLKLDKTFLRNNEIFFNQAREVLGNETVEFPGQAREKLECAGGINIMWFLLSFVFLLAESGRRIFL